MAKHLLILIHGITPEAVPQPHNGLYENFWRKLQQAQPALPAVIRDVAKIEWGNRLGAIAARADERLSDAERRASDLARTEHVQAHPGANNVVHPGPFGDWNLIPGLRLLVRHLREQLVQFGLADALYYASQDGERAVRAAVYGQVLRALRPHRDEDRVVLHVVGHSLGVTVAHDFLFGLFGKIGEPDYLGQAASGEDRADYTLWRDRARKQLFLGSFTSMASQLPLFAVRSQALVDRLAAGGVLSPTDIGVVPDGETQWLIVYDVDDPLGFATRELYGNTPEVRQVQVDVGDTPIDAHLGYWTDATVIRETARLIATRAGVAIAD